MLTSKKSLNLSVVIAVFIIQIRLKLAFALKYIALNWSNAGDLVVLLEL